MLQLVNDNVAVDVGACVAAYGEPTGHCMSLPALRMLARVLELRRPRSILEFGPGISTLVCLSYWSQIDCPVQMVSVEHDGRFFRGVQDRCRRTYPDVRGHTMLLVPLIEAGEFYDMARVYGGTLEANTTFDMVIVDGPPGRCRGTVGAVETIMGHVAEDSVVVVDDSDRPAAQKLCRALRGTAWYDQVSVREAGRQRRTTSAMVSPSMMVWSAL